MRILVTPQRLLEPAGQFQQISAGLMDVENRCQGALTSLDWEARQRAGVEGEVQAAVRQACALAEQAEALARFLSERATAFQQADAEGAQDLGAVTALYLRPIPVPVPTPMPLSAFSRFASKKRTGEAAEHHAGFQTGGIRVVAQEGWRRYHQEHLRPVADSEIYG